MSDEITVRAFRQHSCEVRLKLAQWYRRSYHLKICFLFLALVAIMDWCGTILSIFVERELYKQYSCEVWLKYVLGVREVVIYGKLLIQHDAWRTTHDVHWPITIYLTMCTLCSGELKNYYKQHIMKNKWRLLLRSIKNSLKGTCSFDNFTAHVTLKITSMSLKFSRLFSLS